MYVDRDMWEKIVLNLGTLAGGTFAEAMGINDERVVVGFSNSAMSQPHAFLWSEASHEVARTTRLCG